MKSFDEWQDESELETVDEALSLSQRMKMGRRMARMSSRIQRKKAVKQRRMADRDQLTKRAIRAARNILIKKLMSGKSKAQLSITQKIAVSKKLEKKSAVIKKISKKLFPKIMKAEKERLKAFRAKGKEIETPGQSKKI
jgi:hypothetical protein